MDGVIVRTDRWSTEMFVEDGRRAEELGYVANGAGASFRMRLDGVINGVRTINVIYMKSYGKKWEGSKIRTSVRSYPPGSQDYHTQDEEPVAFELEGIHNPRTSVPYEFMMELPEKNVVPNGDTLILDFNLMGRHISRLLACYFVITDS